MNIFNKIKKSQLFTKKSYYGALAICLVMVGVACFYSYNKTTNDLTKRMEYVAEKPVTTAQDEAIGVDEKKDGVKKEKTVTTVTVTEKTAKTEAKTEISYPKQAIAETSTYRSFSIPINGEIIQDFSGEELVKNQTTGAWQTHNGIDISGNIGDEVKAMAEGTVLDVFEDHLWGVVVVIDHGDGMTARYCGLNKGVTVEKDAHVSKDEVIGALGNTADIESSMEVHLHFEIIRNDMYLNPIDIINNQG
ncbi:MAG: M23 family metallopeptidase [Oscillospiraceae bacterium]|nr:M23 family metallopeptidase [Oscillospiraceae bacterium]